MKLSYIIIFTLLFSCGRSMSQDASPEMLTTAPATSHKCHLHADFNLGIFYFPIYDLGGNGYYKVDGHRMMSSNLQYYCAIPGQQIWTKYTTDFFDQATFYYLTFTWYEDEGFNKNQKWKFIVGLTHDKAQTNNQFSTDPYFKLNDGGGEVTFLVSYGWQIGKNISRAIHDSNNRLKIEINFQAGPFIGINEDTVSIAYDGQQYTNKYRASRNPWDRRYEGYGLLANVHSAFGYDRRVWGLSLGLNIGGELQHHVAAVRDNYGVDHRLTLNSYSLFITPTFNIRVNPFAIFKKKKK